MSWIESGGLKVVVIGASGGIGSALVDALEGKGHDVRGLSRSAGGIDLEDEGTIARAADAVEGELDLVIIASGILSDGKALQPEKSWRALDPEAMARVYRINTIGPALCAKHFLPKLPCRRRSVLAALSARVGSIGDNRLGGWHSYRASKAALNMLLKTFSVELRIRHKQAVCIGLHPGTVDTGLSRPFQANVRPEKLFGPAYAAARILEVIDQAGVEDSGKVFDFAGVPIEP